ncbi:hypothetical protein EPH95_07455 [Salicibibacter halophilus]|uniref:Uncharacterized protein n=1 Tax=Salicibibacter halophilus TaxID=2502791 RepID=A0A514LGT0_9BACI|nr:hypothetical protein EPH95_07455 [Salicibibacter halophilus]
MTRHYYKPPPGYGKKRPPSFFKWRYAAAQILLILICFQTIRTIFLPTTFDVLLLVALVSFYWYFRKKPY